VVYHIQLIRGIIQPYYHFSQISQAEEVKGSIWRLFVLILCSGLLNGLAAYFGLGTEEIMKNMNTITTTKLEWAKVLFGIGHVLGGMLFPVFFMFFFSILFLSFFKEVRFDRLLVVQLYALFILIIEKLLNIPLYFVLGIDKTLSPYGLGIIIQLITDNTFLIHFLSSINFFQVWAAFIQIIALKVISEKSLSFITSVVFGLHLLFIIFGSIVDFICAKFMNIVL
jgi:hypothetical protein